MVQEFNVLRCYSCQTYQVQQVKKSKKWNCKMCGEKQSVLKEFGRGSGVDCRRHVQKLNARRGEILEQDQKACSQWKEVGDLAEEQQLVERVPEDGSHNSEQAEGSRWTKYLPTTNEDTADEEEENVYMDRNGLHDYRNLRKRKRGREESKSRRSHLNGEEDHVPPTSWRLREKTTKTHNGQPSSFAPADRASKQSGVSRQPVPAYSEPINVATPPSTTGCNTMSSPTVASHSAITSQPYGSCSTEVSKNSKWAQFLTPAPPDEELGGISISDTTTCEDDFQTIGSMVPDEVLVDQNYTKPRTRTSGCASLLAGGSGFLGKIFDRPKSTVTCGFGETANSGWASHMTLPQERHQPPPTTNPCPALSLRTLFYTDDDFDDTF